MKLAHLGVAAGVEHRLLVLDAVVPLPFQPPVQLRVGGGHAASLHGVEHLGGMEGEHGRVPHPGGGYPVPADVKGVSRVVDQLQPVLFGHGGQGSVVAEVAVHMHRQDGAGARGNERLHLRGIHGVVVLPDVAEHRGQPGPDDGVSGGRKGEGRSDDLALQPQRLQKRLQRQMAVGEQRRVGHVQPLLQRRFQFFQFFAVIGQPMAVPQAADFFYIFI